MNQSASPISPSTPVLTYVVDLDESFKHLAYISLWIPVNGQEQTEIVFPVWTPGSYMLREYTRNIEKIAAQFYEGAGEPKSTEIPLHRDGKNRWFVQHQGRVGWLKIEYRLYCRENSVRTNWLDCDYGFLTGAATFPSVEGFSEQPIQVALNLPSTWQNTASSLKQIEVKPNRVIYQAANFDDLVDSPIVCGNFTCQSFESSGREHYLVHVNSDDLWNVDQVVQDVSKIVAKQHQFWPEVPYQAYWFLNLCTEAGGGLEHDNSTVLMCSRWAQRSRATYIDWLSLVSHEFFHTWNVRRLRPRTLMRYDYEAEQFFEELWIAEGITSYFDDLFVVRCGLFTPEEYLTRLSTTIQAVQSSHGRLVQDLANASWDAWVKHYRPDENTPNARISYYLKGCLVAWLLDARLRQASDDRTKLDDVMRQLWIRYHETGYTHDDFADIVEELGNSTIRQWLDQQLRSTTEFDFAPALEHFGLCFQPVVIDENTKADPKGWIGCETAPQDGKLMVRRVFRNSSADRAGLNVDDELISIGGYRITADSWTTRLNDSPLEKPLELLVSRRGKIRQLELICPPKPTHSWQLVANPTQDPSRLFTWIG